jgi:hypothetical protein
MKNPFAVESENAPKPPVTLFSLFRENWLFAIIALAILLILLGSVFPRRDELTKEWDFTWSGKLSLMLIAEEAYLLTSTGAVRGSITYNIGPFHLRRTFRNDSPRPPTHSAAKKPSNLLDPAALYYSNAPRAHSDTNSR